MPTVAERVATARRLADELDAYVAHHRLARWKVSVHLFKGARNGIPALRGRQRPTCMMLDRVRAFLDNPPPPELKRLRPGGNSDKRKVAIRQDLANRLEALIAEHDLLHRRVALHLLGSPNGIRRLRGTSPQQRTIDKIEAFLAAPDIEAMRLPPAPKPAKPRKLIVRAPVERQRLTFEEQLERVRQGRARVVPVYRIPSHEPAFTLGGVSAGLL